MNLVKLSLVLLTGASIASITVDAEARQVGAITTSCPVGYEFNKDKETDKDAIAVTVEKDYQIYTGKFHVQGAEEKFPQFDANVPDGSAKLSAVSNTGEPLKKYLKPGSVPPKGNVVPSSYKVTCTYAGGGAANYDDGVLTATYQNANWQYGCYTQPGMKETIGCW